MNLEWKEVDKELPPEDGFYFVTNNPFNSWIDFGTSFYDGYGFMDGSVYKNPRFWSAKKAQIKRYGKVTNEQ